jgi:SAM-dependent methyltransferase
VFDPEFHRERLYLDLPPFTYIADRREPGSVLDVGCGGGGYLRLFRDVGITDVLGVDGFDRPDGFPADDRYVRHDLRQPLRLGRTFEMVVCTEVIEHLPEESETVLLETLDHHAIHWVLFSAARPGQPGLGHVNCKPTAYWIERWKRYGWSAVVFDSLALRALSTFHWFRRNFLLLAREDDVPEPFAMAPSSLESFEAENVDWSGQPPAVHRYPACEPLPSPRDGCAAQADA